MQNQGNSGTIVFAELEMEGRRMDCPICRVPVNPHLGNMIVPQFHCEGCRAVLTYRELPGRTVRCPCCHFSRPVPNSLVTLVCGRCEATIIHQKGARVVKCSLCKHITVSPVNRIVVPQVNRVVPPQVNRSVPPQVNLVAPPDQVNQVAQVNRIVHPQVNQVAPPQVNQVAPPGVNRVAPPGVNRVVPPQGSTETDSTASSSSTPTPDGIRKSIKDETAKRVAQIVRDAALRFKKRKSEEEDKSEESKSKESRH